MSGSASASGRVAEAREKRGGLGLGSDEDPVGAGAAFVHPEEGADEREARGELDAGDTKWGLDAERGEGEAPRGGALRISERGEGDRVGEVRDGGEELGGGAAAEELAEEAGLGGARGRGEKDWVIVGDVGDACEGVSERCGEAGGGNHARRALVGVHST